jgi:hypothetical protein
MAIENKTQLLPDSQSDIDTDHYDSEDNKFVLIESDNDSEDDKKEVLYEEWDEVRALVQQLEAACPNKEYLNSDSWDEEKEELILKFNESFKDIDDDDTLKFDVLALLARLGITPTKKIDIENAITEKNKYFNVGNPESLTRSVLEESKE